MANILSISWGRSCDGKGITWSLTAHRNGKVCTTKVDLNGFKSGELIPIDRWYYSIKKAAKRCLENTESDCEVKNYHR